MPKVDIDYSNTIIYKITCKDETISDAYVGHTTNFVQRKYAHKIGCVNINNNCKLYQVIRDNGGWENWKMEVIDVINCKDVYEARKKEQEYFVLVKSTLNSIEPLLQSSTTKNHRFYCEKCNFRCCKQSIYNKHLDTTKHKQVKPVCSIINYETDNNTETDPDTNNETTLDKISQPITRDEYNNIIHLLHELKNKDKSINEEYNHENDIYPKENIKISAEASQFMTDNNNNIQNKLILELLKSNTQLQNQLYEICKSSQTAITNNISARTIHDNSTTNTNNSNNNTFNMNMFLNEKCKDAMNMKDFVNSIQLNITDLENVGRLGYVEGMSNIFIDNLQKTDLYKRPVHCSDVKRETLYVKDNNQWQRDGPEHEKMTNAVLAVEQKNVALVSEWAKANPRCMNSNTRENETYFKLSKAATDGEKDGNIDKVIRKVAKSVAIEKRGLTIENE
jgi:hypothetical protein